MKNAKLRNMMMNLINSRLFSKPFNLKILLILVRHNIFCLLFPIIDSYFTICGSKTLSLGKLYKLSLNSHGGDKIHKFNISIDSKEKQQIVSKDVEITGEENKIVELEVSFKSN